MLEKIINLSTLNTEDINLEISDYEKKQYNRNQKRDEYYKNALTKIHQGKWFVWNWSACLGSDWMMYRKMYRNASLFSIISLILIYILSLTTGEYLAKQSIQNSTPLHFEDAVLFILFFTLALVLCICLLSGLIGNKIYYHHLKKKLSQGYSRSILEPTNSSVSTFMEWYVSLRILTEIFISFIPVNEIQTVFISTTFEILFFTVIFYLCRLDYSKSNRALNNSIHDLRKNIISLIAKKHSE